MPAHSRALLSRVNRRLAHYAQQAGDLAHAFASGGRGLGDATRVRTYRHYREIAERFDLDVRTVLYVGANVGQELDLLTAAFPLATVHCFEPQPALQASLRAHASAFPRAFVHELALSAAPGTLTMQVSDTHDQASSLLPPAEGMAASFPHVGAWREVQVNACRLDEWAAEHTLSDDLVLKMDVQGAEGLVLDGGPATLAKVRLLIVEMAVVPTYVGAPGMLDMFTRLLDAGFVYAGELGQVRDTHGAVVEFDGAFVRVGAVAAA